MPYIYSTSTNDTIYAEYRSTGPMAPNEMVRHVLIKGGANRANKNQETFPSTVTEVSDDDLEFLEKNELFQEHKKNGFIKVVGRSVASLEKAAKDMTTKDRSAPKTPNDSMIEGLKISVGTDVPEPKKAA